MPPKSDKEAQLKELSWRISTSATVVSTFFISFIAFYLSGFGMSSLIFSIILSALIAILLKFRRPLI
ncbi:MAG: hypothetical protein QXK70_04350 [Archaeoglobaceae archaeon]